MKKIIVKRFQNKHNTQSKKMIFKILISRRMQICYFFYLFAE